ncbi:hypothetical protein FACS1894200_04460 [Spirochaetia bacterium]|nr:hypothetical protein FACS1894200_04460 [Spirochaetia bacterium]
MRFCGHFAILANMGNHYKDSLFRSLFDNKTELLKLYNSIKGTHYDENTELHINTLAETVFSHQKNDVSFIIDRMLVVLAEHQSTINQNMPFRFLSPIIRILENYVSPKKIVYGTKLVKLPHPEFIVLYNGKAKFPAKKVLRLSKAFKPVAGLRTTMELVVTVYNINHDKNKAMLANNKTLSGYTAFVDKVQEEKERVQKTKPTMPPDEMQRTAVAKAIEYCKQHGILVEYWQSLTQEELNMLATEWNLKDALEVREEEIAENALQEGLSLNTIHKITGLSIERLQELQSELTFSGANP